MIHPETEVRYIDEEKGYGLFATSFIPRGTITWVLDKLDKEITSEKMADYEAQYQEILLKYSYRNKKGNYIFCWDNGRYINHSFRANCCVTPYNFEIAIRDIKAGEELTDDYGTLNIIAPFEADSEGTGRSVVYPDDLLRHSEIWDKKIAAAFPEIVHVAQLLEPFIPAETGKCIEQIIAGKDRILSIKSCYYVENLDNSDVREER